ncbi:MAG TPA: TrkA C-terminal domain-containing protein [Acidimicrobiales bacterium]|nr:TrkA C-terminal domain-containing protein [Acidimicrobiales bacterium]
MIAISSLLLVVAVSLLITRVATVVLVASGMSASSARFQARSAFTGAGFTTSESEKVVDHPLRRRVIMNLMLLGNAGIVASASSLILGFRGGGVGRQWEQILELGLGLLALIFVSRSRWVDRRLTDLIAHFVHNRTDLARRDLGGLLQLSGDYAVQELAVRDDDWVAGRTLGELGLRDEGIAVLGLTRPDGSYLGAPTGASRVNAGDVLVVYGTAGNLRELDQRPAGPVGDRSHQTAVARQEHLEAAEATRAGG